MRIADNWVDYELINMDDIKIIVEKGAWDDDEE